MVESLIDSLSQETKKKSFLLINLLLISIIAGLFYFQPGVGYEIISNGQHVGYARSKLDAELAVNSMKNHILEVKGSEAKFDANITFVKGKLEDKTITTSEVMQYNFENSLDIKIPAYVIKKDNEFVMAVADEDTANQVLEAAKTPYLAEKTDRINNVRAEFVQNVQVVKLSSISETKVLKQNEALAQINPSTSVSRSNIRTLATGTNKKTNLFDVKTTYQELNRLTVEPGVKKVPNSDLFVGETKLLQNGKTGVREVYSQVTLVNGNRIEKKTLDQKITKKPVDKVVYYGTKPKPVATRAFQSSGSGSSRGATSYSGNATGVVGIAMKYLGTPYVYGGSSPRGFDCSGFTQYVYKQAGVNLPRTSGSQTGAGQRVSISNLKSGDLLYGPGHVGIYIGNGQFIHSPAPGQSVKIQPVSQFPRLSYGVRVA